MKKVVSIILTVAMIMSFMPIFQIGASATEITLNCKSKEYNEVGPTFFDSGLKDSKGVASRYSANDGDKMVYTPNIPSAGEYEVSYYILKHDGNEEKQQIIVKFDGGEKTVTVDCKNKDGWVSLGKYKFAAGTSGSITLVKGKGFMRSGEVKISDGKGATAPTTSTAPATSTAPTASAAPSTSASPKPTTTATNPPASAATGTGIIIASKSKEYVEKGAKFYESQSLKDALGNVSRYSNEKDSTMTYTPNITEAGEYEVSYYVMKHASNAPDQKVIVKYDGGQKEFKVDCTTKEGWVSLGKFQFAVGTSGYLQSVYTSAMMRSGGAKFDNGKAVAAPSATPSASPSASPKPSTTPSASPSPSVKPVSFNDIGADYSWAKDSIVDLAGKGIVNGKEQGKFDPSAEITRAEFLALAVRIAGVTGTYKSGLSDVKTSDWFANTIQAAIDAKLVDSALIVDGKFLPDAPITREEMTSIIVKTYEYLAKKTAPTGDAAKFGDASTIAIWAKNYVGSAVSLGIIQGVGDNKFAPKDKADRAQAAVMIFRLLAKTK